MLHVTLFYNLQLYKLLIVPTDIVLHFLVANNSSTAPIAFTNKKKSWWKNAYKCQFAWWSVIRCENFNFYRLSQKKPFLLYDKKYPIYWIHYISYHSVTLRHNLPSIFKVICTQGNRFYSYNCMKYIK